jgi:hypothetical protein
VADFSVASLPSIAALTHPEGRIVGTPTELYTRLARGALTCWFGAAGPLKGTYIYHADAEPASKGGRSEIVIFANDTTAADPRALRAFRIGISTAEEKTKLEVENIKMPEPLASRLEADVSRWAADQEGCGSGPVTAGWTVREAPAGNSASKSGQRTSKK